MNQLEALINSLIKMGWKPWGIKVDFSEYKFGKLRFIKMSGEIVRMCTLRELVSLESGLWQFCMEKGLYKKDNGLIERYPDANKDDHSFHYSGGYQYRLIESALVPQEDIPELLVNNIVI